MNDGVARDSMRNEVILIMLQVTGVKAMLWDREMYGANGHPFGLKVKHEENASLY